ncbi:MAG: isocitrate lyase/PEP mutase family protein [Acidobacteriota bacterium]
MDPSRRDFVTRAVAATGGLVGSTVAPSAAEPPAQPLTAARPLAKTAALRALLRRPGVTMVPEAHSVYAARLAELNGFEAIYIGGNMMSAMYLGVEDWGLINTAELVEIGGRIANGVSLPAIVDADQGGETALNVYRSLRAYERAGIAGFHIEDTRNPKHMGQGKSELMGLDEMMQRIAAAVDARTDPDFVIIARSDSLILGANTGDVDESIRRGQAFAKAGADAFFCVGMRPQQAGRISREVPIPVVSLNVPMADLQGSAVKLAVHAVQVYQPAMKLYETMIAELKEHGQFLRRPERTMSPETAAKVMRTAEYQRLAEQWMKLRG